MREKLIEVLAEPGTGAALRLEDARRDGEQITEGRLVSELTGAAFPIVRGIPRFVPDEAYTHSFGRQWNHFRTAQVDSATGAGESAARFDAETGWQAADLQGKWLLDAGCGAGRFAEVAAARGAQVVALDFSSAVEAAAETLRRFPNADVVQGDLLRPPLRQGRFDFAYCIGVAQHTPDPPAAVASVVRCVHPDGRFSFTIYARQPWTRLHAKYLLRPLTRRLPPQTLLKGIEAAMPVVYPLTDRLFRVPVIGRVARFLLPVATYTRRPEFTEQQRYEEAVLDTFDMLAPRYDQPMTFTEVEDVLRQTGARRWGFRSRVPINVVGTR